MFSGKDGLIEALRFMPITALVFPRSPGCHVRLLDVLDTDFEMAAPRKPSAAEIGLRRPINLQPRPLINEPPPLNRDYNKDPNT